MVDAIEVKGYNDTVRFDGSFVTIVRRGFLARVSVGKGEKQIPVAALTAVQFKPAGPLVNGFIQFTVGGGNERRSTFGRQTQDAVHDENSVIFHYGQRRAFERLRDVVQAAMAAPPPGRSEETVAPIPEQIRQLAELRDAGVITPAEFEAKKSELLDRM